MGRRKRYITGKVYKINDHVLVKYSKSDRRIVSLNNDKNNMEVRRIMSLYDKNGNRKKNLIPIEKYPDIISWCAELPNALETEDFVFTHAGLGKWDNWRESSEQEVMKNDPFIYAGVNTTGKWLVCGHMPTWNSRISSNTNNCFVDRERKIAFTDGGNQVKDFAQLNALIIDCADGEMSFSTVFESWYPRFTAKVDFDSEAPYGSFKDHWPEGELEVISHGEDFSYLQRTDGSTLYAANTHLNIKGIPFPLF